MRVRDCMTTDLVTCHPEDSDAHAAQLMWERDCGVLPVVDESDRMLGYVGIDELLLALRRRKN